MLDWIKEHPYLTGGVILGAIVLWVIIRNRSQQAAAASASSAGTMVTGPSDALQEAELAAGVQTQTAQLAAQAQIAQTNSDVNAVQLNNAAAVTIGQQQAGVANTQTAAQLQLGLAQFGYSPSQSPFGLTVPVGGNPAVAVTAITPVTTPAATVPATTVGYGSTATDQTTQLAAENALVNAAGSSGSQGAAVQAALAGITSTPGGGESVPAIPVYVGPGGGTLYGYTAPETLPSSAGQSWQQYFNAVSGKQNTGSVSPISAGQLLATQVGAEEDYLTDPNSCHNRVCTPGDSGPGAGGGGYAVTPVQTTNLQYAPGGAPIPLPNPYPGGIGAPIPPVVIPPGLFPPGFFTPGG